MTNTIESSGSSSRGTAAGPSLDVVDEAFGQNADLYVDVLRVAPNASPEAIQMAYFDRRSELFSLLTSIDNDEEQDEITASHRYHAERKMDAVVMTVRILGDPQLRKDYDELRKDRIVGGRQSRALMGGSGRHSSKRGASEHHLTVRETTSRDPDGEYGGYGRGPSLQPISPTMDDVRDDPSSKYRRDHHNNHHYGYPPMPENMSSRGSSRGSGKGRHHANGESGSPRRAMHHEAMDSSDWDHRDRENTMRHAGGNGRRPRGSVLDEQKIIQAVDNTIEKRKNKHRQPHQGKNNKSRRDVDLFDMEDDETGTFNTYGEETIFSDDTYGEHTLMSDGASLTQDEPSYYRGGGKVFSNKTNSKWQQTPMKGQRQDKTRNNPTTTKKKLSGGNQRSHKLSSNRSVVSATDTLTNITNSGFISRIQEEVSGTVEDTVVSLEQILNVFTLQERDIRAVTSKIDKAKRQLHHR